MFVAIVAMETMEERREEARLISGENGGDPALDGNTDGGRVEYGLVYLDCGAV